MNLGLDAAISRKPPQRVYERKMEGKHEAHLIALVCSEPPEGRASWSLRLLAERFVQLEQVEIDSISHETVRQVLKNCASQCASPPLGGRRHGVILMILMIPLGENEIKPWMDANG